MKTKEYLQEYQKLVPSFAKLYKMSCTSGDPFFTASWYPGSWWHIGIEYPGQDGNTTIFDRQGENLKELLDKWFGYFQQCALICERIVDLDAYKINEYNIDFCFDTSAYIKNKNRIIIEIKGKSQLDFLLQLYNYFNDLEKETD